MCNIVIIEYNFVVNFKTIFINYGFMINMVLVNIKTVFINYGFRHGCLFVHKED